MKSPMLQRQHQQAKSFVAFPDLEPSQTPSSKSPLGSYLTSVMFLVAFAFLLTLILVLFPQVANRTNQNGDLASRPTPTPTPIILIPDEGLKGNYIVSQARDTVGPRITKVTFDPLDARPGDTLNFTIKVSSKSPVTQVVGALKQDTAISNLSFSPLKPEDTGETFWSGSLTLTDTVLYNYILKVNATNAEGTASVVVAPRSTQLL